MYWELAVRIFLLYSNFLRTLITWLVSKLDFKNYIKLYFEINSYFFNTFYESFKFSGHFLSLLSWPLLIFNFIIIISVSFLSTLQMLNSSTNFTIKLNILCFFSTQHYWWMQMEMNSSYNFMFRWLIYKVLDILKNNIYGLLTALMLISKSISMNFKCARSLLLHVRSNF